MFFNVLLHEMQWHGFKFFRIQEAKLRICFLLTGYHMALEPKSADFGDDL